MDILFQSFFSALFSGGVIAIVLAVVFHQRTKAIEQRLRVETEERISTYCSTREWKEMLLAKV